MVNFRTALTLMSNALNYTSSTANCAQQILQCFVYKDDTGLCCTQKERYDLWLKSSPYVNRCTDNKHYAKQL